ncbi:MAG: diaminopimelate decarboxylase [Thermoflavifilum sp.]|nr:diaminopimelate decarboxylase [Thermoflavifilum sp.]MCL6515237.1 diaminopimelate decarboxylase [Alicyclobacillus sp.]
MEIRPDGHLWIGGCDTVELAARFGTPLFVYDEAAMRATIRRFHAAFQETGARYEIAYAAKAFCTIAMCQLAVEEGCAIDAVSGGEMYTALAAGVTPDRIRLHGNNKSYEELEYAVANGIRAVIVDNFVELGMLAEVADRHGRTMDVLLRISPGVEAHTHEYISTGQQDSKFGFDLASGAAHTALREVARQARLRCIGLHCHIGSQIFDTVGFTAAIERMAEVYEAGVRLGLPLEVLNVGGGFGIRYTEEDDPAPIEDHISTIVSAVRDAFGARRLAEPEVWIEPGRSIVGPAGITLYRVGTQKRIPGVRNYVAVDGGMTDNPRWALYGARYQCVIANRAQETPGGVWSVAGKCCESGDMLIWDAPLPDPEPGDIIAVFATGAYNYSMASHYNRLPKPGVVFVRDGQAALVVERETWADVVRMDRPLRYDMAPAEVKRSVLS